jgi:hypothetical protein
VPNRAEDLIEDTPLPLFTHFLVASLNTQRTSDLLDDAVERAYEPWGLDTVDTDESLDDVPNLIRCGEDACLLEMDFPYTVEKALTEEEKSQLCRFVVTFFLDSFEYTGNFSCSIYTSTDSADPEVLTLVYIETEDMGFDDYESDFVYSVFKMKNVLPNLPSTIEPAFSSWSLDLLNTEISFDSFDRRYTCGDRGCSYTFLLYFTLDESAVSDKGEAEEELCNAIREFFSG